MTKFTRLLLIVPLLSIFTAASLSGALAADKKSTSGDPIKERHQDGRKERRRRLQRAGGIPAP